jgi:hypothetical protein
VPIVILGTYGQNRGSLYAFAIPEDFSDLYVYPAVALNMMRKITARHLGIYFTGPSKVSLFLYDNGYFILENFADGPVDVRLVLNQTSNVIEEGGQTELATTDTPLPLRLNPHQYRVFHRTPIQ